ncbi:MAG: CBS domain-containing protein [Candidatus Limimorpha sp.]
MIVRNLIQDGVVPLEKDDTCREALEYMEDLCVAHLPLVHEGKLVSVVSNFDIYRSEMDTKVGDLAVVFQPFVYDYQHVFDALRIIGRQNLTLLPVLDAFDNYLGTVSQQKLVQYFTDAYSVTEPGGIIVLEMSANDYMLSEIARIVEEDDAKILSLTMESDPESTKLIVSIKVSKVDISAILQTFNRFNYNIVASFSERDNNEDLRQRYSEFIKYLNM